MAITDKIYVKNHRQIGSQLETNIPKGAFKGATLDMLFQGENLAQLDDTTQERVLDFAEDFLDCDCQSNPYCGCPERKFMRYLLDLREPVPNRLATRVGGVRRDDGGELASQ